MEPQSVALVFGTRPEAIKVGPVYQALLSDDTPLRPTVIVTGQHRALLDQMLAVFGMTPTHDLAVMSEGQTPASLTGLLVPQLTDVLRETQPDIVLVQGDTTTSVCGAMAAFYNQIPVAHLEAGLRTSNKYSPFPEEINRRLTSHMADVHLAPTPRARHNLQGEGLDPRAIFVTGNTIVDALLWVRDRTPDLAGTEYAWVDDLSGRTILTTIHRRENLGVPFTSICLALLELAAKYPDINIIFPMHPNPKVRAAAHELLEECPRIRLCEPPDYLHFVALMQRADLLIVDSGGIQEEAPALHIPVLVVRETTERPEGIEAGVTRLVGTQTNTIVAAAAELLDNPSAYEAMASGANPYGDGRAAQRVVGALEYFLGVRGSRPPDYDWRQDG
ncbi:MAG: UDP-N-acetylglucosamine 2-epimerase (non-hydrolyzing) [Armatimonadetes bacterium]|nr:UDP-N-acetylglucosamine 2-epimerase (non-hydrolyzing) [Armatimonadota bacterium]